MSKVLLPLKIIVMLILGACLVLFYPQGWGDLSLITEEHLILLLLMLCGIFICNFFVVSVRFLILYRQLGYNLTYTQAYEACLAGQIANLFFLPFVGSMLGQRTKLLSYKIPNSIIAFAVIYERIFVSAVGAGLSLLCLFIYFKSSLLSEFKVPPFLLESAFSFTLITSLFMWKGLHEKEWVAIKSWINLKSIKYTFFLFLVTTVGWIIAASAFGFGIAFLTDMTQIPAFIAGGIVTSFIASLPVSINGWGIREIATITVFGTLGVLKLDALCVSVCIGIASILAIFVILGIDKLRQRFFKKTSVAVFTESITHNLTLDAVTQKAVGFMGYLASFLILFMFHLQQNTYQISINLADVLAFAGLFIFTTEVLLKKRPLDYIIPSTQLFLIFFTVVLTIALMTGLINFGFSKWAFFTRYIGWFCLMGYFGLGVLCKIYLPSRAVQNILNFLVFASCAILFLKYTFYFVHDIGLIPLNHLSFNLEGYALNRNAFAFQLLIVTLLQFNRCAKNVTKGFKLTIHDCSLSILIAGIIMTASRAAWVTLAVLVPVYLLLRAIPPKNLIKYAVTTGFFVLIFSVARDHMLFVSALFKNHAIGSTETKTFLTESMDILASVFKNANNVSDKRSRIIALSDEGSNAERLYTWLQGIKMGLSSPFLGAGLGAFLNNEIITNGRKLIIHSTPIWIWAECGLLGLSLVFWHGTHWVKHIFNVLHKSIKLKEIAKQDNHTLVGLFIVFITMGLAHDILYQRIFWFILGITIVRRIKSTRKRPLNPQNSK